MKWCSSSCLDTKDLDEFNVTDAESSGHCWHLRRIDCVESWAIFVEQPEGHYCVRLRKSIVINEIAKRHDGGGHPRIVVPPTA